MFIYTNSLILLLIHENLKQKYIKIQIFDGAQTTWQLSLSKNDELNRPKRWSKQINDTAIAQQTNNNSFLIQSNL